MAQPYKVLALGDSVMWGQGLAPGHRFIDLVAGYLASTGKQVEVASLTHSGAVVCDAPALWTRFADWLFGELPRSFPSIASQLETAAATAGYGRFLQVDSWDPQPWQDHKRQVAAQIAAYRGAGGAPPDLILLDGGINDLGALQIVVPWNLGSADPCGGPATAAAAAGGVTQLVGAIGAAGGDPARIDLGAITGLEWLTPGELEKLVDRYVTARMRAQLQRLAAAFPTSRVIVTGYFPIFTEGSIHTLASSAVSKAVPMLLARPQSSAQLQAALAWALHPAVDQTDLANRIIEQSELWYSYSTKQLAQVVADANKAFGNRFALASPVFGPDNGAFAPKSLLWTFTSVLDEVIREILKLFGGQQPAAAAAAPEAAAPGAAAPGAAGAPGAAAPGAAAAVTGPEAALGAEAFGLPAGWGSALAFLAGLSLGGALATDEVAAGRAAAARAYVVSSTGRADPATTAFSGFTAGVASAGHPNLAGAKVYFEAIRAAL